MKSGNTAFDTIQVPHHSVGATCCSPLPESSCSLLSYVTAELIETAEQIHDVLGEVQDIWIFAWGACMAHAAACRLPVLVAHDALRQTRHRLRALAISPLCCDADIQDLVNSLIKHRHALQLHGKSNSLNSSDPILASTLELMRLLKVQPPFGSGLVLSMSTGLQCMS